MKTITLVSNTQIIIKIFNLVCSKLDLKLIIVKNESEIKPSDILVLEDKYFDTNNIIRYKSLSSNISIIAKEKIYEYESFNIIKKPFLPSQLKNNLSDMLKDETKLEEEKIDDFIENNNDVSDLVDFIDSIEEEKSVNNQDEEDIFISKDELGHGGVLDKEELDILHEMINDENDTSYDNKLIVENNDIEKIQDNDWLELSDIIDRAINDVQATEVDDELFLLLEEHTMLELSPLLNKLNQNSIDRLSNDEELVLRMKLKKTNER